MMLFQHWGKAVFMAVDAPGQLAVAVYQVHALCQVFYQAQCWLRSTGLAKRLGLCMWEAPGILEDIPSQWQNAINNSHKLLRGLTAGGLTWFAQCGKLLDMTKSPGKQVGAGGAKGSLWSHA